MPERAAAGAVRLPAAAIPLARTHPALDLWLRWTIAVALGELIGFGVPAIMGVLAGATGILDTPLGRLLLVLAGAGEGAVLALAEWLVLRRVLPGLPARGWVAATAAAAALAWALGLLPSSLGESFEFTPLVMAIAALLGVVFLLTIGGSQWLILRHHVQRSGWWIVANAIAWPAGVAMPVLALTSIPDDSSTAVMLAAGVLGGLLMGAVVGAITGIALVRLVPPARPA